MVELDEAIEDPPKLGRNLPEESFGGSCSSDFLPREESRLRLSMGRRAPPMAFRAGAGLLCAADDVDFVGAFATAFPRRKV